jgi:hypothetical protein
MACFRTGADVSEQHEIPRQDLATPSDALATLTTYRDPMQALFFSETSV